MTVSDSLWTDLAVTGAASDGFCRRRVAGSRDWALYAAVEAPIERLALLLEVPTRAIKSAAKPFPQSSGLTIDVDPIGKGASGRLRLILRLGASEFRDVFVAFSRTIVDQLSEVSAAEPAVTALFAQVVRWQRFLDLFSSQAMSDSAQLGLYGELTTLIELAGSSGIEESVSAWTGPSGAPQDFQFSGVSVEVKATRGGPPYLFRATSVGQLDVSDEVALFLGHLVFERIRGGERTLPRLVDDVRRLASSAPSAARELEQRLQDAGYIDAHSSRYIEHGYIQRKITVLEVRKDFPRIRAIDLPTGIGDITYTIQMAAVERFQVEWRELAERLERRSVHG